MRQISVDREVFELKNLKNLKAAVLEQKILNQMSLKCHRFGIGNPI